jgi:hypothetical protein
MPPKQPIFTNEMLDKMQEDMKEISNNPFANQTQEAAQAFDASPEPFPLPGSWKTTASASTKPFNPSKVAKAKPVKEEKEKRLKLLKVGADVEEFLKNKQGKPVPVIGLIGGSKERPMPVLRDGFALQEDNVALEYNIPPASDPYEFVHSLLTIQEEIGRRLEKMNMVPAIQASMRFEEQQLEHPQAKALGCEPDYCVWTQSVNEKPDISSQNATLRTAGGHIHVSFEVDGKILQIPEHIADAEAVIMALDVFLGVPFSIMDPDKERMKLYGKAGAFRPKPYGIEYRTLSNFWTRSPQLMGYTFNQVKHAFDVINKKKDPRKFFMEFRDMVNLAINQGHSETAKGIMQYFSMSLPK